jgi:elongation factor Ts
MNESFVKMAEMANQALNFDKRSILASDFNGITIADKLIEQTSYRRKLEIRTFDKLEGACRVLYPLWKQDCYFSCII